MRQVHTCAPNFAIAFFRVVPWATRSQSKCRETSLSFVFSWRLLAHLPWHCTWCMKCCMTCNTMLQLCGKKSEKTNFQKCWASTVCQHTQRILNWASWNDIMVIIMNLQHSLLDKGLSHIPPIIPVLCQVQPLYSPTLLNNVRPPNFMPSSTVLAFSWRVQSIALSDYRLSYLHFTFCGESHFFFFLTRLSLACICSLAHSALFLSVYVALSSFFPYLSALSSI